MGFWSSAKDALLGGLDNSPDPNKAKFGDRDYIQNTVQQGIAGAQNRQAPQAGGTTVGNVFTGQGATIAQGPQTQFRGGQMDLANRLQGIASGQMQGAGEMAVQRQVGQAIAGQQAMARSARGGGAGLAFRGAARNAADVGVAGAGQAQMAALQDQSAANAQLAGVLGQGREQDVGLATSQANLGQQMNLANLSAQNQRIFQQAGLDSATSLANMQAKLQAMGMNDAAALGYLQQLSGMNQAELAARMQQEQAAMAQPGLLGGLISAGGTVAAAAASDVNLKTDITDGADDVDEVLSNLKPYAYRYHDEKHGQGRRLGVMAQDMESTELGRSVVVEMSDGKGLDIKTALSLSLAANARLAARCDELATRLDLLEARDL
jgi:hypothetical protein